MSTNTVISYPIPPYQNVPIRPEFYAPRKYEIANIVLGEQTIVMTTIDNDYVVGQQVRLIVPSSFGTRQLNERSGYVLEIISPNEVLLDIVSSQMDAFINSTATTRPQILAIGDINSGPINTNGRNNNFTYIPGSFKNISPQ